MVILLRFELPISSISFFIGGIVQSCFLFLPGWYPGWLNWGVWYIGLTESGGDVCDVRRVILFVINFSGVVGVLEFGVDDLFDVVDDDSG